jgi:methylenetetrahydrofolate dehydrogenase (NADP+)/methenyltetrahydrofolate cyclohydrolase
MKIIDGRAIAQKINAESRSAVEKLRAAGITPGLAVVLLGDDPASRAYVRSKDKMCQQLGMYSAKHELPEATSESAVLALVTELNADPRVHGILVQSPPPAHIDERAIVAAIDPRKDVDGFHPGNVAKLALGEPDGFVPCTPLGCQRLLIESGIETNSAHVVVLGRSMIVGKPLALLLMQKGRGADATVTVAHSRTRNLPELCRTADILVAAIGRAEFVTEDFVREGAVVIDVGINRVAASDSPTGTKLVGDVAFDAVAPRCAAITPVPGGVGPMTIAMLMSNTILSCQRFDTRRSGPPADLGTIAETS